MRYTSHQRQRYVDVSPAVKDPEDRLAPGRDLVEHWASDLTGLAAAYYDLNRKFVEWTEPVSEVTEQVIVPVEPLLHENQAHPLTS